MLCISIRPTSEDELRQDFAAAKKHGDIVEIRLDGLDHIPTMDFDKPTLLSLGQKGSYDAYLKLAAMKPAYLDISCNMPKELFTAISGVKIIASYHNFEETPDDLQTVFDELFTYPAHMYKCVCMAQNTMDGYRMLKTVQKQQAKVIGFCMGDIGAFTRPLAKEYGSAITYVGLPGKPTAPGQRCILQ